MPNILELTGSSDSEDDVDYVPPKTNGAPSDSDEEGSLISSDDDDRRVQTKETADDKDPKTKEDSDKIQQRLKQHADDLWRTFLNDVESITPPQLCKSVICNGEGPRVIPTETKTKAPEIDTKPVSKEFEFAEETVIVDKDEETVTVDKDGKTDTVDKDGKTDTVDKDGETATVCVDKDVSSGDSAEEKNNSPTVSMEKPTCMQKKRGLDSVVGALMNKPKKLTVLEKSILDWNDFKKDEGLDNELEVFNRGKNGFIERKRFLERSDLRSFEMEKSMRQTMRKK